MTQFKPESHSNPEEDASTSDARLVAFVQHHAPLVPEASLDLEDRLMGEIAASSTLPKTHSAQWRLGWPRYRGLVAIASCSLFAYAAWQIYRILTPRSAVGELAEIDQLWLKDFDSLTEIDSTKVPPEWDWLDSRIVHRPPV